MWWVLFLIGLIYAANEYETTTLELRNFFQDVPVLGEILDMASGTPLWFTLGMIGVMIAFLIALALRFTGQLLNSPQIMSLGNVELREFVFSFILLIALYLIVISLDQIVSFIIDNMDSPGFTCDDTRLQCITDYVINKTAENQDRLLEFMKISFKSSAAKYGSSNEVFGVTIKLMELLHPTFQYSSGFKNYIAEEGVYKEALNSLVLGKGVIAFLKFLFYFLGPLGISLGAILRPLPFTRRVGATILALGIGFYLMLPGVLALLYSVPPELAITYNNDECPGVCKEVITAYVDGGDDINKGLPSDNVSRLLTEALRRNLDDDPSNDVSGGPNSSYQINDFYQGNIESLVGYDPDTETEVLLTSCEYQAKNIPPPSLSAVAKKKAEKFGLEMERCPDICRRVPYPYNNPQCYFADSACQALWEQYPACFKKMYDLDLLKIKVRLVDGTEEELWKYLKESNCFKILPLTPGPEDYAVYCPMGCRAYYNEMVWSDLTKKEVNDFVAGSITDKLNILEDKVGSSWRKTLQTYIIKEKESIFRELVEGSTPSIHESDKLIMCGSMFSEASSYDGGVCYGDGTKMAQVWNTILQHIARGGTENDNYVRDSVNDILSSIDAGEKAVEIAKMTSSPSSEIVDYPIFANDVYPILGYDDNPSQAEILETFRDKMVERLKDCAVDDVTTDPDFGGTAYSKTFSNIWDSSYLDVIEIVRRVTCEGATLSTKDVETLVQKSPTIAAMVNSLLDGIESAIKVDALKYGKCNPNLNFEIGCNYADSGYCPGAVNCSPIYALKYEEDKPEMPDEVWKEVVDNLDSMTESDLWNILDGVYLPIEPRTKDCSLSSSVHPDLLRFPPSPDCSKCDVYDVYELQNALNMAAIEIGKYNFRMFVLPLFGIYLTIIGIIGLSQVLGGEIFIPGITRVH